MRVERMPNGFVWVNDLHRDDLDPARDIVNALLIMVGIIAVGVIMWYIFG